MARQLDADLKAIVERYHPDPRSAIWDCHGKWVIYHKACEAMAVRAGIRFDPPVVLEADGKNKAAALCVTGTMGERSEWSVGEAAPGNNKNAYPFAMAEKRAKDRVILKLLGLHGLAYSEEEADDFKQARDPAPQEAERPPAGPELFPKIKAAIAATTTERDYFAAIDERGREIAALSDDDKAALRADCHTHLENIRSQKAAA